MDKAISMAEFVKDLSEQDIADLKAKGIELGTLEQSVKSFGELDIPEPKYDEKVIGTLTEEELKLFVLVASMSERLDDLQHELQGSTMIAAGQAIKEKAESPESIKQELEHKSKEFEEFFKCERKVEAYKSALYLSICSRLGYWDWGTGIRSKQRIVVTERKW